MDLSIVLPGVAGLVLAIIVAVVVASSTAKGWALLATVVVGSVTINNSAPSQVWVFSALGSVALLIIGCVRGGLRFRRRTVGTWLLVSWLALAVLGAALAGTMSTSTLVAYFGLLVLLALTATALSAREIRIVLRGVLVLMCIQVGLAAAEFLVGMTPLWGYRGGILRENPFLFDAVRSQGTFGQPIVMGYFMAIAGLIAWNGRAAGLKPGIRLVLLVVAIAGTGLSGTRSAFLALVTGIAVHLLMRPSVVGWLRNLTLFLGLGTIALVQTAGFSNIVSGLLESGSWTHRLNSLNALDTLLSRETGEMLWGSGWGSEITLFDRGLIQLSFGLKVVDNFIIYVIGTMGVIGLLLLIAACVFAFGSSDALGKAMVVASLVMFFSFDLVVWFFAGMLLVVTLTLSTRNRAQRAVEPASSERLSASTRMGPLPIG